jgi:hypothetical protein
MVARTPTLMIGVLFAAAGGFGLYSGVAHQIKGRPATATLLEHISQCTVGYQHIGEEKRKEKSSCEQAEEFQRRVGPDKIKVSYENIARVQFPLGNGRTHEVNVDESKLGSYKLPIGTTLPVVYAPDNPADVRAEMSWERLKVPLGMFAFGIACLAFALGGPLAARFGWTFGGGASRAGEEPASAPFEHPASTLAEGRSSAPASVNAYSPATGPTSRPSFGMRNR